ncbi:hypothetical protein ABR738_15680 [Streptomyces sp. Edi4]|uniref:hypothetical protein n=1 Tax=Streptomyces sp. Edi4 TaxID=3162527 RepID=UPI0033059745
MDDVERLVAAFKEMRVKEGVTTAKLRERPWMLDLLQTPGNPTAALKRLDEFINLMGDTPKARAVRNALNIELEWHGELEERRNWARGLDRPKNERFLEVGRSTHIRLEEDRGGFGDLAHLIVEATTPADPFQSAGPVVLDDPDLDAPVEADEPDDQSSPPAGPENAGFIQAVRGVVGQWSLPTDREQLGQLALVGTAGVGLVIAITLILTGVIPLGSEAHHGPDKVESATVPTGVTVRSAAAPKIDNGQGWGPERKTFTMQHPSSYPVFNSITDQPGHGDERNFVQCKDTAKDAQGWDDEMVAKDGHTYECMALVVNDIAPNLDSIASPNVGGNVAAKLQGARLRIWFPDDSKLNPGLTGILSANNAEQVWDSCNFVAARPVSLRYVLGSARMRTNNTPTEGVPLPGAEDAPIHDKGVLLGDNGDGLIGQNGGYVSFKITATLG